MCRCTVFATSQSERHVQSAHSLSTLFSWEWNKERSHVHGHVHDQNQRTGQGHGTGTATRRIVHWWTTGTRWDDMSGCWSSGTMRRAQYQRAQQRAPSSSMCPWSCDATQYGPSFSGTSKACLSHLCLTRVRTFLLLWGAHRDCSSSGLDKLPSSFALAEKFATSIEDGFSYTQVFDFELHAPSSRSGRCQWPRRCKCEQRWGFDDLLNPAARFSHHRHQQRSPPVVIRRCHACLGQDEPRPRSSCRRLWH